jgi:D-alanyl-D-alanine carboxypeptidase
MRNALVAALASLLAAAGVGIVLHARAGDASTARPAQQRVLDELVASGVAPGAAAYVSGPHGTWTGAAGVADAGTEQPMPADGRFRLESVTKIWIGTLVLLLAEDGRLALDDTVERHLPGLLPFGGRITLAQLLDHTSGILDTNDVDETSWPGMLARIRDPALRAEALRITAEAVRDPAVEFPPATWVRLAATQPLAFEPGTGFHYSNIGYEVLGLVAEEAGGAPLARLLEERIARPLGLRASAYDPHADIAGPHVRGYSVGADGQLVETTRWTRGVGAAGGIVSNAADTARFLQALMRGELLGPASLAAMTEPRPAASSRSYGLGIGVGQPGCAGLGPAYGHNGGGDGFTASVWVSRDGSRVAVVLANGRAGDRGDRAVFGAMRELYCGA